MKREPFPSDSAQHPQSAAVCPFVYTGGLMSHFTSLLAVRNNLALYRRSKPHIFMGHTEDKKQPALEGNRSNYSIKIMMHINYTAVNGMCLSSLAEALAISVESISSGVLSLM